MKVITPGVLPEEKKLLGTCTRCKCKVEFAVGEARRSTHRNETTYTVDCPTIGCFSQIQAYE